MVNFSIANNSVYMCTHVRVGPDYMYISMIMIMITITPSSLPMIMIMILTKIHDCDYNSIKFMWLHCHLSMITMNTSFSNNISARQHLSGLNTLPAMEKSRSTGPLEAGIDKYWHACHELMSDVSIIIKYRKNKINWQYWSSKTNL